MDLYIGPWEKDSFPTSESTVDGLTTNSTLPTVSIVWQHYTLTTIFVVWPQTVLKISIVWQHNTLTTESTHHRIYSLITQYLDYNTRSLTTDSAHNNICGLSTESTHHRIYSLITQYLDYNIRSLTTDSAHNNIYVVCPQKVLTTESIVW